MVILMKIGIVCYPTFGGSGIIATELGLRLMRRGYEVHFISYALPERLKLEKDYVFHEVDVLSYPLFKYKPYTIVLASFIYNLFREGEIDILHSHYAIPHAISAYLAKLSANELKIVATVHGSDIHLLGLDKSYKPMIELSLNNHDAVTTVSYFMKNFIKQHYDVRKEVEVIYNFVDPAECIAIDKSAGSEIVITHVSNFRKVKRTPDIIRAFAKVSRKHENIRLEMIGDGPELDYCRDLAISLGINDKVRFRGSLLNVPKVLRYTDIFVMPSEIEAFGLAALEAMAHGIPVIASNAGGLPEVITHGKTGFLVTPGDIDGIAYYMNLLIENEDLRLELGKNARKDVIDRFHPDKIVPKYEAIYKKILNKN